KLGIDPVTMRLLNCYYDGSKLPTQAEVPKGVNLANLITACAREIGIQEKSSKWSLPIRDTAMPHKKRGIGIAAGMKNSGFGLGFPEGSEAKVVLNGGSEIEKVVVLTAADDVGQGSHSALSQIAAETLNVAVDIIQMVTSDTTSIGDSGSASASRLTLYAGNAVKFAAQDALQKWNDEERPAIGYFHWKAPATTSLELGTKVSRSVNSITYGAHAVEVEVDTGTGKISLLKVVAAHDPGKMVNPQQVEGQIEGGVMQAIGWSLLENFIITNGKVLTDKLSTYLIPTVMDIPGQIVCIVDELPDPIGPFGVRGIGEIPFIPLAPAIISAVHNATAVWINQIPITPEIYMKNSNINQR
ncbi:MAG: molybdopterin-dependent oxidoreductase, partial [Chloroflexi bacterium]|nr:molybdopterin-dependent oxidoreductase [Chloroflexota bacterium]